MDCIFSGMSCMFGSFGIAPALSKGVAAEAALGDGSRFGLTCAFIVALRASADFLGRMRGLAVFFRSS
jgi:hypothetical protein